LHKHQNFKLSFLAFLFFGLLTTASATDQYSVELLDENDGFNTSIVFSIVQDSQGFLWFGTAFEGVMRFDGKNVLRYSNEPSSDQYLAYNNAGNLVIDGQGKIWIGGWGSSVSLLNPEDNQLKHYAYDKNDRTTISDTHVQELFVDFDDQVWLGTRSQGLNRFNSFEQNFERFPFAKESAISNNSGTSHDRIWAISQVEQNELWIGTEYGLNRLDKNTLTFEHFIHNELIGPAGTNKIRNILPMRNQNLALGTHDGVLIFDRTSQKFEQLEGESQLDLGPVYSMLATTFGQYWVSTGNGIFYFTEQDKILRKVPLGIEDSCSQTLFEDKQGIIWLSCEGSGIYKIVPKNLFKTLNRPIAKSAYSLTMAEDGNLLIGTQSDGIYKWDMRTGTFAPIPISNSKKLVSVNRLLQLANGDIWFTDYQDLYRLNTHGELNQVIPPKGSEAREQFTEIIHITQVADGSVWIGTSFGVFVINDVEQPFKHYGHIEGDESSLTNNRVHEIYEDPEGGIWVGADIGLNLWQPKTDTFRRFYTEHSSPFDAIKAIHQDSQGDIWVGSETGILLLDEQQGFLVRKSETLSNEPIGAQFLKADKNGNLWTMTHTGVMKYDPITNKFVNFDKSDGLSGSRYFVNLVAQSENGTIFISSRDGIHYFDPAKIENHELSSPTILTGFDLLGSSNRLPKNIQQGSTYYLTPDQNYIKFEFSTLDMLNARQIRYFYKLEGLDTEWIDNGNSNVVVYTNLAGGDYKFRVRPETKSNLVYDKELIVDIHIATPIWRQYWMIIVYVGVMLLVIQWYVKRRNLRNEKEIERQKRFVVDLETQVAQKTQEIRSESKKLALANKIKSQFLANMSHEIRTPLTAIVGLSESVMYGDVDKNLIDREIARIHNHSRHLMLLVNDILDITKIEDNKFELDNYQLDIHILLNQIKDMFVGQAEQKGLEFNIAAQLPEKLLVQTDGLRLKQVLINLCANAIKFTEQGVVTLIVTQTDDQMLYRVVDTGIGMSEAQIANIFEVFSQGDSTINRRFGGSGLGLALSQKIVMLMGGELSVSSDLGKGSIFTFSVPLTLSTINDSSNDSIQDKPLLPKLIGKILLAEDHTDNQRFIARLLQRLGLEVVTANNGIEAIQVYQDHCPEVILLDIQMPLKDGIQTFRDLRKMGAKEPIIAITANAMTHDIERYKNIGFNGYLTKPIDRQQLIETVGRFFKSEIDFKTANDVLSDIQFDDIRDEFIAGLDHEITLFSQADATDKDYVSNIAHRLTGAAQLLGFTEIAEKASALELSCDNEPEIIADLISQLIEVIKQVRQKDM
jgi:signal transduction histidine kinase/CheY-like chemotaxis protein/streptogramin lyase